MNLMDAVKIVGNEQRKSYPEFTDAKAVEYSREFLMLPGTGYDPRWEIERYEEIDPTFDAFELVLKATDEEIAALDLS